MLRRHHNFRISGHARREWERLTMPGTIDEVVTAIFAGEGMLIAEGPEEDSAVNVMAIAELRGYTVEIRGQAEGDIWVLLTRVSATPVES